MLSLLSDDWNSTWTFDLLDAGGGLVSRLTGLPDGTLESRPDPFGLSGRWKREHLTLSIVDANGAPVAHFSSEGLDNRGRLVIWGAIRIGSQWLEHCLRDCVATTPRISFCIVSRNRLHHLRETLPRNISDNRDYPTLEFVVLDYNSEDGMGEWVKRELGDEIASGRLNYYFAPQPTHFRAAHARNMAVRLATGDIVCVVDADNFTGRGFASYLADNVAPDTFLIGCHPQGDDFDMPNDPGCLGRSALYKSTYLDVGGMDEAHVGWGYDDADLYFRLRSRGYRFRSIESRYVKCIPHDDSDRRKALLYQHIGRDRFSEASSVQLNARRSQANILAGRIVLNEGRIGCGYAVKNFDQSIHVVGERRDPKISVCIACSDRGEELRDTLPGNVQAMRPYANLEFILLDGPDGLLEEWLGRQFPEELSSGRIDYCRLNATYGEGRCENPVRQRNVVARLAAGDIVCLASPADNLAPDLPGRLARKFHAGWVRERIGTGSVALSRHLFYLSEGLDQTLSRGEAESDLLRRIEQREEGHDRSVWSRSGLESRDFGAGTIERKGETVVLSAHRFPRVSFAITYNGDLERLLYTLPQNLADNRDYPNLEIVLFDYGDRDGLEEWLRIEMKQPLESGRLVYYRANQQSGLSLAHASNMSMRLATGELLCSLDGGSFTGHQFAFHLAHRLEEDDFLSSGLDVDEAEEEALSPWSPGGIAMARSTFYASGGFDEGDCRGSAQRRDLRRRLRALGYRGAPMGARFLAVALPGNGGREAEVAVDECGDLGPLMANGGPAGTGMVVRNFDPVPIEVKPFRFNRISLCITCMNRLHHLSQTLPSILADNKSYPDLEVVLLDYNSSDGLEAWAKENLRDWIENGRLVFFRTTEPSYFRRSHARNLAFRLASGEILCTVDADNFTGRDFAHYINERFERYGDIYLRPDIDKAHAQLTDTFGRISVRRQDFLRIEGYDEQLVDYGFEDIDLCFRLEKAGLVPRFIEADRFLRFIHHGNRDRVVNGPVLGRASMLLRGQVTGEKWETLIYLLRNGEFIWRGPRLEGVSSEGRWQETDQGFRLSCDRGVALSLAARDDGEVYQFEEPTFDVVLRRSDDLDFFSDVAKDMAMERNERRYRRNLQLSNSRVNAGRFGHAVVSRNFNICKMPFELIEVDGEART